MARGRHQGRHRDASGSVAEPRPIRTRHGLSARRVIGAAEALLAATVLAGVAAVAVGAFVFHLGLSPVLTGSMRPTFSPGDAVITRAVPVSSIHPGDVTVFVPPGETSQYAHRVTSVRATPGGVVITTKGDANPAGDAWHATLTGPTAGKVVFAVPKVGRLMVWFATPLARALAIALVGLVLTAVGTRALLRLPVPVHAPIH